MGEKCFTTALNTSRRGDFSFKTLVFPCPVCDIFRPVGSDGGCEREKVHPAHEKCPKIGGLWRAGRTFSRKCRWKGCAGRTLSRASSRRLLPCEIVVPRWRPRPAPGSRACSAPRSRVDVALDVVLVRALDLGLAPAPTCRAHQPPRPSASGPSSHPSTAFPQDSSHFAENATHPYI